MREQEFRDLMAGVCAPVTVVTTLYRGRPFGATVSAFASLSLRPPMVNVALDRRSTVLSRIRQTDRFGVNVLGSGQDDLAMVFAQRDTDRFSGVDWFVDHDLPRLAGVSSWLSCKLDRAVPAGDHVLLLGLVTSAARAGLAPLIYGHRMFGTHSGFATRPRRPITDHLAAFTR
jgi:flavin reductase (DIM6/NTAB) family NADH-FMN oxidoreductase RutF